MSATTRITAQYLTGNSPEGLDHDEWVARLTEEYRLTVLVYQEQGAIPTGPIEITVDVQRNVSGACRVADYSITDDGTGEPLYHRELERDIEAASGLLWERVCADPTMWHDDAVSP